MVKCIPMRYNINRNINMDGEFMIEKEVLNKIIELYKKKKSFTEISKLVG